MDNAARWMKENAHLIPGELAFDNGGEGHLSLNFRQGEGEGEEVIATLPDEDHWYLANDREEIADPDADWL